MKSKQTPIKKRQEHPEPTIKRSLLFSQNCSFQLKSNPQRNFTKRVSSSITYTQIRKKRVANRGKKKIFYLSSREKMFQLVFGVFDIFMTRRTTQKQKEEGKGLFKGLVLVQPIQWPASYMVCPY
jgi:hypothetical protein